MMHPRNDQLGELFDQFSEFHDTDLTFESHARVCFQITGRSVQSNLLGHISNGILQQNSATRSISDHSHACFSGRVAPRDRA